jgi:hypothetical protein
VPGWIDPQLLGLNSSVLHSMHCLLLCLQVSSFQSAAHFRSYDRAWIVLPNTSLLLSRLCSYVSMLGLSAFRSKVPGSKTRIHVQQGDSTRQLFFDSPVQIHSSRYPETTTEVPVDEGLRMLYSSRSSSPYPASVKRFVGRRSAQHHQPATHIVY